MINQEKKLKSMAVLLWLFILSTFHVVALAQQRQFNITLGSSLTPTTNSSWFSPSRRFAFGFYEQTNGYAVGISIVGTKTAVWTANRNSPVVPSNAVLLLTSDGRLIVQVGDREISVTDLSGQTIASASMLDIGNFVLYDSDHNVIWESFGKPTNTLLPGQHLSAGQELVASASEADDTLGLFRLKMQYDGNLVLYPVNKPDTPTYAYYATRTSGPGSNGSNVTLNLDDDGALYLLNSTGSLITITEGGSPRDRTIIYLMKIDVDGMFRVYSHSLNQQNSSVKWSSTNESCALKGLCGLNGFCINMDTQAKCSCLPGFDFVMAGNWSAGCERNFTAESCRLKNSSKYYAMRTVENTVWEGNTYATSDIATKEECEQACLRDCNCEAALFKDRQCRKQRLPLRYVMVENSNSNQALVKVGINAFGNEMLPDQIEETKGKKLRTDILIASITLAVFALLVLGISGFLVHRNHIWTCRKIQESRSVQLFEDVALRAFSYAELEQATAGFKEALGRGAFGTVFKGTLAENQKVIAVKRLDRELVEGESEFQTELKVIGRTHHRNLVRLLGYCLDGSSRLLVYEYMSNGSLADVLFTPEKQPTWEERCYFARDIARGLLYLHDECETQIIHCDIKPQNILMDEQFCAKISDFGMAKLLKKDQTRTYTAIRGTIGYVAPEWHRKLPVTVKADVYSFGVVLLELICRRKHVDNSLDEKESILEYWVYNCFEAGELDKLIGEEEVDIKQFERMVKISIWCIQDEPSLRPSMKKVLLMLEGTVKIPVPPSPTSFLSSM